MGTAILGSHQETLIYAVYYAPRGRLRLYRLGSGIAQRHLLPTDLLIGVIGSEGAGKSTLIRGIFPGLELVNDDDGINMRSAPLFDFAEKDVFGPHTYHIDVRYEQAFHQLWEIAEAVTKAVKHQRRVIVEHFDLLYPHLEFNAQILLGIGEEVLVARPSVFGPFPEPIRAVVHRTVQYRKMAHSAEDITSLILSKQYGIPFPSFHSDVKHGFAIGFADPPNIDLKKLEDDVKAIIAKNLPITPVCGDMISIGTDKMACSGMRTHVKFSGQIEAFRLLPEFLYNPISNEHLLVGIVGDTNEVTGYDQILKIIG